MSTKLFSDFRNFIARGNVMDLAIGMIIGAAFTTVVKSLVDDIVMPVIGLMTDGVDFSNMYINLSGGDYATRAAAQAAGDVTLNYGMFVNAIVHFFIVALVIFFFVRVINNIRERAEDPTDKTVKTPQDIQLLRDIRDLLADEQEK